MSNKKEIKNQIKRLQDGIEGMKRAVDIFEVFQTVEGIKNQIKKQTELVNNLYKEKNNIK